MFRWIVPNMINIPKASFRSKLYIQVHCPGKDQRKNLLLQYYDTPRRIRSYLVIFFHRSTLSTPMLIRATAVSNTLYV